MQYNNLSLLRGSPPKVVWFRARYADIQAFDEDSSAGTLALG